MAIIATSKASSQRELIEPGNYVARCYRMIQIGTVKEIIKGVERHLHKVRVGWELPTELRVFQEDQGEQPLTIEKEYTLSMNEKAHLRNDLKSWRGKDFTEEEAESFDITNLLGVACMLNIIHKPSKDGTKHYEEIAGITKVPKGLTVPPAINNSQVLSFDNFDSALLERLPDFIKDKIKSSDEYKDMISSVKDMTSEDPGDDDDVPF